MRLKSKVIVPPGGWYFDEPASGLKIEANDYDTLIERVITHRIYKLIIPTTSERKSRGTH